MTIFAKDFILSVSQDYKYALMKLNKILVSEAVTRRCSVKEVFLESSQNSQEKTCAIESFWIKKRFKKRLWHRCFSVNFAKFLRTSILTEHVWWLPLWSVVIYFTKNEDHNLCKFIFKFNFIFTLLPCGEICNHKFKTRVFHSNWFTLASEYI